MSVSPSSNESRSNFNQLDTLPRVLKNRFIGFVDPRTASVLAGVNTEFRDMINNPRTWTNLAEEYHITIIDPKNTKNEVIRYFKLQEDLDKKFNDKEFCNKLNVKLLEYLKYSQDYDLISECFSGSPVEITKKLGEKFSEFNASDVVIQKAIFSNDIETISFFIRNKIPIKPIILANATPNLLDYILDNGIIELRGKSYNFNELRKTMKEKIFLVIYKNTLNFRENNIYPLVQHLLEKFNIKLTPEKIDRYVSLARDENSDNIRKLMNEMMMSQLAAKDSDKKIKESDKKSVAAIPNPEPIPDTKENTSEEID